MSVPGELSVTACLLGLGAFIVSTVCLVLGGFYLAWSVQRLREHQVERYQAALVKWREVRKSFSNLQMTVLVDNVSVTLSGNSSKDAFHDEQNLEPLPEYEALKYDGVVPSGVLTAGVLPQPENDTQKLVVGKRVDARLSMDSSSMQLGTYHLSQVKAHYESPGMYGRCREKHGEQVHTDCWVYSRITKLCVQIGEDGGEWQLRRRNGSFGCTMTRHGAHLVADQWQAATYTTVSLDELRGRTVPIGEIRLEVRSEHDPYLTAMELTHGTLNFGTPALDERVTGIVLIVIGVVLCCLPQGALCRYLLCAYLKSRKESYRKPRTLPRRRDPAAETVGMRYAVGEASDEEFQYAR
eukprot:TRINITY_DN50402_c0_g1_i1.p1 TRINITY_DN50402_c0_g1~~TRINITY_DN50402_c0_g1_i1.p1  ORF type:complete len:362 (-),score=60.75 TRINITY_DN50402_c0_g1_i1:68-1126(-)